MTTAPWPDVDASFADRLAARTPTPFRHGLAGDERLSLEAIALLGDRRIVHQPELLGARLSAACERLRKIGNAPVSVRSSSRTASGDDVELF